jgi:hypothetical protein
VLKLAALPLALLAFQAYHASVRPLPAQVRQEIVASDHWHAGCPLPLSGLRLLTVVYWGFDGKTHSGQLVVNAQWASKIGLVFGKLYRMRFPIHHMAVSDTYGPSGAQPADGDVTASMECRQAVASPCTGSASTGTGHWSMHAYGEAIDLNPVENPYVGCGMTRDKTALSYLKRSNLRRGMVTPAVVAAFRAIGWGWGGSWSGSTKDYMHFSANGH